jgi:Na+/phosphate symporter
MTLVALIPVLMMIVGLLMYALAANPKVAEAGRILFAAGAFALAFAYAGKAISVP